jgi:ketol-acid reductoisomerase
MRDWTIGILGFGHQGRAQALNLRDAGFTVRIGARAGGKSAREAGASGFPIDDPAALGRSSDLVAVLTPDHTHPAIFTLLAESPGPAVIVVAHGFALRFLDLPLRPEWDVLLVAPSGPGTALRSGQGPGRIPALIAVHQDASGKAWEWARAYAIAAGCSETALVRTTVAEEAEVDLFGEQAVLCGGIAALAQAAWETLVAKGYDPEVAYMECIHQVGLTSDMITRFGITGMRERISPLALFGGLTRGKRLIDDGTRRRMAELLDEIRDGRFGAEFAHEMEAGFPVSRAGLLEGRGHPLEAAGEKVRRLGRSGARPRSE